MELDKALAAQWAHGLARLRASVTVLHTWVQAGESGLAEARAAAEKTRQVFYALDEIVLKVRHACSCWCHQQEVLAFESCRNCDTYRTDLHGEATCKPDDVPGFTVEVKEAGQ